MNSRFKTDALIFNEAKLIDMKTGKIASFKSIDDATFIRDLALILCQEGHNVDITKSNCPIALTSLFVSSEKAE